MRNIYIGWDIKRLGKKEINYIVERLADELMLGEVATFESKVGDINEADPYTDIFLEYINELSGLELLLLDNDNFLGYNLGSKVTIGQASSFIGKLKNDKVGKIITEVVDETPIMYSPIN